MLVEEAEVVEGAGPGDLAVLEDLLELAEVLRAALADAEALLGAALGLRIGAALMAPPTGFTAGQNLLWAFATFAKVWLLVLVPLIALSALIEGLVTPLIIRALYGG